jgi:hypothetical protein
MRKHVSGGLFTVALALATALTMMPALRLSAAPGSDQDGGRRDLDRNHHVLLISIDGMHAADYLNCSRGISSVNGGKPFCPHLAELGETGVNYTRTTTSRPSDSFPGLMAIVTGGSPRTFGAFYDVAYDRVLAGPTIDTGNGLPGTGAGGCTVGQAIGTETEYEEGVELNQHLVRMAGVPTSRLTAA